MNLLLTIAGVNMRISCAEPAAAEQLRNRFAGFVSTSEPTLAIDLDLRGEQEADEPLDMIESASGLTLEGSTSRAEVNHGHATVTGSMATLDAVVRLLTARALLARGGLLLHASASLSDDGRGFLFVGGEGSGKSTIAAALPGPTLADEAVALIVGDGGAMVHGTPYWGGRNQAAPLHTLAFIRRAAQRERREMSSSQIAGGLFAATGPLPTASTERALAVAADLATAVHHAVAVALAAKDDILEWLAPRLAAR